MIKVYLDWNCITNNCQGFIELADKYKEYVIFPYSREHIRDLLVSVKHKEEFAADLHTLQETCGQNLLNIADDEGAIVGLNPIEYLRRNKWRISVIQKPFNLISRSLYMNLKHTVQRHFSKEELGIIQNMHPSEVIKYLDEYVLSHSLGSSLEDFSNRYVPRCKWLYNTSSRLKSVYFALDMMGFHSDKKSKKHFRFTNLDIDANHMTNAIYCDYFVTDDTRLMRKTEAIYKRYGCRTKILKSQELKEYLKKI